jgi:V-type H+-transporting ATPase subunit a
VLVSYSVLRSNSVVLTSQRCILQLIIPTDAAHETIAELGELGLLQFKDLNPEREAFARAYASQVCS